MEIRNITVRITTWQSQEKGRKQESHQKSKTSSIGQALNSKKDCHYLIG